MPAGLVLDVKRFAIHDGPGIRTTVFLSGCPLACWWCHNPESQPPEPAILTEKARCLGCGRCEEVCPGDEGEPCRVCGLCADECPAGARRRSGRRRTAEEVLDPVIPQIRFVIEPQSHQVSDPTGRCRSTLASPR